MKKYSLLLFGLLILVSCHENKKNATKQLEIKIQNPIVSKTNESNLPLLNNSTDTLVIKSKCAIIYEPTENYINKSKKEVGEENFYISVDDALFYISASTEYLNSKKIKIVNTENDKILKFISINKSISFINLNLEKEMFGIYFFDPNQNPKKIDITNITGEFEFYMK